MNAPVCPISRNQAVSSKIYTQVSAVSRATDLPSLIAAVNALRQELLLMITPPMFTGGYSSNVRSSNSSTGDNSGGGGSKSKSPSSPSSQPSQHNGTSTTGQPFPSWYEGGRDTTILEVYNQDSKKKVDNDQYVVVRRIDRIEFHNNNGDYDKDKFVWKYKINPTPHNIKVLSHA